MLFRSEMPPRGDEVPPRRDDTSRSHLVLVEVPPRGGEVSPRGHATPWSHLVLVSCHLVEVPPRGATSWRCDLPPSLFKEEVRPFLKA